MGCPPFQRAAEGFLESSAFKQLHKMGKRVESIGNRKVFTNHRCNLKEAQQIIKWKGE